MAYILKYASETVGSRPRILISANDNSSYVYYVDAVEKSGGAAEAVYCPPADTAGFDGLILSGGADIDPARYGERINGARDIDRERDAAEFALLEKFISAGLPVMGICRGCQLLNVFFGGTLHQDIPCAGLHRNDGPPYITHEVMAAGESVCSALYGGAFTVNSRHHQAVKKAGDGLRVTLAAGDIAEGIEHGSLPVFGVQFHPEMMCYSQKREDTVDGAALFKHFVGLLKNI